MSGRVHRTCAEDRLEESEECSEVMKVRVKSETRFVCHGIGMPTRILTGQWCELESRSGNNLCGVDLNAVIFVDSTSLGICQDKYKMSVFLQTLLLRSKKMLLFCDFIILQTTQCCQKLSTGV